MSINRKRSWPCDYPGGPVGQAILWGFAVLGVALLVGAIINH
jgi:hypothetical protein